MAYTIDERYIGVMPIASTDAGVTQPNAVSATPTPPMYPGMVVRAFDPTYGEGEFILLAGVTSTAIGSVVTYNTSSFTSTLAAAGNYIPQPIAIAMAANTSSSTWGWYQIGGLAIANKNSVTASLVAGTAVGVSTVGVLNNTASGVEVEGAVVAATATATTSQVQVMLDRPHMMGRIT